MHGETIKFTYSFINIVIKELWIKKSNFVYVKFFRTRSKEKPFDVVGTGIL
jgi:hypothetical protein